MIATEVIALGLELAKDILEIVSDVHTGHLTPEDGAKRIAEAPANHLAARKAAEAILDERFPTGTE